MVVIWSGLSFDICFYSVVSSTALSVMYLRNGQKKPVDKKIS